MQQIIKCQSALDCLLQLHYTPFTRSSKHQANIEQLEHTSCTCILNAFAGCLLNDCSMFVNGILGLY